MAAREHGATSISSSWLEQQCAIGYDEEGNMASPLPALLASALDAHMVSAAAAEAAAHMHMHPAVLLRSTHLQPAASSSKLYGSRTPAISIHAYAERLLRYCHCSPVCFAMGYAYALRLAAAAARGSTLGMPITHKTAHRLLMTGTVVAIKMSEDKYYTNAHYAQVGGVSVSEMNAMEMDLLQRLGYRARVDVPELCAALQEAHARAGRPCVWPLCAPALLAQAGAARVGAHAADSGAPAHTNVSDTALLDRRGSCSGDLSPHTNSSCSLASQHLGCPDADPTTAAASEAASTDLQHHRLTATQHEHTCRAQAAAAAARSMVLQAARAQAGRQVAVDA